MPPQKLRTVRMTGATIPRIGRFYVRSDELTVIPDSKTIPLDEHILNGLEESYLSSLLNTLETEDEPSTTPEHLKAYKMALSRLPEFDKRVLELRYVHRLAQKEIGEIMGVSQTAISHKLASTWVRLQVLVKMPPAPDSATIYKWLGRTLGDIVTSFSLDWNQLNTEKRIQADWSMPNFRQSDVCLKVKQALRDLEFLSGRYDIQGAEHDEVQHIHDWLSYGYHQCSYLISYNNRWAAKRLKEIA